MSDSDASLLERLKLAVDSVRDYAIFLLSPEGHVQTWNEGARALKGYEPEEIIGQSIALFYPPEDARAGLPAELLAAAVAEGRVENEGWRVRKDGSRFWADVVITAVRQPDGSLVGFTKVTRDLTERIRLEEERLRRAQAEEALRLRDQFLSIASHELRTPLTVLQLQLEGIELGLVDADPRLRKRLERALRSGERMADLVEALLDVSRIASGKLELQRRSGDLALLVEEVVDRFEPVAQAAGCALVASYQADLWGLWDRLRIEQVVTNLLGNATKFGAGSPVHVHLDCVGGQQNSWSRIGDRESPRENWLASSSDSPAPRLLVISEAWAWDCTSHARSSSCTAARSPRATAWREAPAS